MKKTSPADDPQPDPTRFAIERFAAGTMTAQEENDVLIDCELEPELWRDVALAFVEQRALKRALADPLEEALVEPTTTASAGHRSSESPREPSMLASTATGQRAAWRPAGLAIAASVLLALAIGPAAYLLGSRHTTAASNRAAETQATFSAPTLKEGDEPEGDDPLPSIAAKSDGPVFQVSERVELKLVANRQGERYWQAKPVITMKVL